MSKSKKPEELADEYVTECYRWATLSQPQRELVNYEIKQAYLAGYIAALENWNPSNDEEN